MDKTKKEITQEEAEEDFKNEVADIFAQKVHGVYRDQDGFIVIPRQRKKNLNKT